MQATALAEELPDLRLLQLPSTVLVSSRTAEFTAAACSLAASMLSESRSTKSLNVATNNVLLTRAHL
jgi:hypothetical protein